MFVGWYNFNASKLLSKQDEGILILKSWSPLSKIAQIAMRASSVTFRKGVTPGLPFLKVTEEEKRGRSGGFSANS